MTALFAFENSVTKLKSKLCDRNEELSEQRVVIENLKIVKMKLYGEETLLTQHICELTTHSKVRNKGLFRIRASSSYPFVFFFFFEITRNAMGAPYPRGINIYIFVQRCKYSVFFTRPCGGQIRTHAGEADLEVNKEMFPRVLTSSTLRPLGSADM